MFSPNCVVLVPSPEIMLKSPSVRVFMLKKLKKNISLYLTHANITGVEFIKFGGRMVLYHSDPARVISALLNCFGIYSLCLAQAVDFVKLEDLYGLGVKISDSQLKAGTFAVRGKSFSKSFSSKKLEEEFGSKLLSSINGLKVKLTSPEREVFCIAQDNKAFFYFVPVSGAKGMPVGCQRRACIILNKSSEKTDNEISSLVFSILKCGSSVCFVGDEFLSSTVSEKLVLFNSFRLFKHISLTESMELLGIGELEAFFSFAKSSSGAKKDSEFASVKVFAPFISGATRFSTFE